MIIEDGQGQGASAQVDDHGRLYTKSNVISHMSHHATFHKNAFIEKLNTVLQGASLTTCAIITNDSNVDDVEIHWLRISADADMEIRIFVDSIYTSGGNEIVPENTNRASKNVSVIQAHEGGATGNLLVNVVIEKEIDGFFISANKPIDINLEGGIVLGKSNSYVIKAVGADTNKVKVVLATSNHAAGTKL